MTSRFTEELKEVDSKLDNSQDAGEDCGASGNDGGNPQGDKIEIILEVQRMTMKFRREQRV